MDTLKFFIYVHPITAIFYSTFWCLSMLNALRLLNFLLRSEFGNLNIKSYTSCHFSSPPPKKCLIDQYHSCESENFDWSSLHPETQRQNFGRIGLPLYMQLDLLYFVLTIQFQIYTEVQILNGILDRDVIRIKFKR